MTPSSPLPSPPLPSLPSSVCDLEGHEAECGGAGGGADCVAHPNLSPMETPSSSLPSQVLFPLEWGAAVIA